MDAHFTCVQGEKPPSRHLFVKCVEILYRNTHINSKMGIIRMIYSHEKRYLLFFFLLNMSGWPFIAIVSEKISENVGYAREAATEAVLEDT